MHISLLGPTNLIKFSALTKLSSEEVARLAEATGKATAGAGATLTIVFNYAGMLSLVGEAHKKAGGALRMLYTQKTDSTDWETAPYEHYLKEADETKKLASWHHMLLSLVSDADIVVCAGLSAGVLAELAYMKWNVAEKRGRVQKLIGIKELLRDGHFPAEIETDLRDLIKIIPVAELTKTLSQWKNR
ncbi:MAG: hypothetical protein EXS51_02160 [Candidatus Taylorbacteria bacterium]|nr:hypothetical protein [Candidatus Taylorbacteria bacterium]